MMMKRMELERYNNKLLLCLAKQKSNPEFDKMVREIIAERVIFSNYSYLYTYRKYKKSDGVEKLAYGDALATHLVNGEYLIETEVLDSLLPTLSIETLCDLSNNKNGYIRDKARSCLVDNMGIKLEEVVITRPKVKVNLKRKGELL